ncbi:MAG: hypothetical protein IJY94_02475 [Clostridia bacterium]|nr:hypothetical protein [Clostridia bacterium]
MKYDYEYERDFETKKGKTIHFKVSANRLVFGILFIACAVLIILDAVGVSLGFLGFLSGIPAWVLILTLINLIWLIDEIIKLKFSEVFFPIAFIFMLLEKHIAKWCGLEKSNIINNWLVILCALLLMIGAKCIIPKRRFTFTKTYNNKQFCDTNEHKHARGSASTVYVDCGSDEETVTVRNELGACSVYFSDVESYKGNKTLCIHNELGAMTIHVPSELRIISSISNELGSVSEPEDKGSGDKIIRITGSNELGSLRITRV